MKTFADDAKLSASDQLVKWFDETRIQFYLNPTNMISKMKKQDEPVRNQRLSSLRNQQ